MKRVLFGLLWFVVLWLGTVVVVGGTVGVLAVQHPKADGTQAQGFQQGYDEGNAAGKEFGRKYGLLLLLIPLALAVAGTATGKLPGTARKP